jgi:hypothetical protein
MSLIKDHVLPRNFAEEGHLGPHHLVSRQEHVELVHVLFLAFKKKFVLFQEVPGLDVSVVHDDVKGGPKF